VNGATTFIFLVEAVENKKRTDKHPHPENQIDFKDESIHSICITTGAGSFQTPIWHLLPLFPTTSVKAYFY